MRAGIRLGAVLAAALAALPAGAHAAAPKVSRVEPAAAIAGAALELRGSGLKGRGTRVTVGGKRARVLRARARRLRFVVPKLRPGVHRVVVRRGLAKASARLRVLRPFDGDVVVRPDRRQASTRTIGADGGDVVARGRDGTTYLLRVPAGALAAPRELTVTPARSIGGLPLSGPAFGVALEPDGLDFATPATLTIRPREVLPRKTAGFTSHDGFELQKPGGSRRALTLRIDGFSSGGAAGTTAADFANAVQPLLSALGPLTESQVETLIELIGIWEELFPPEFCITQPVCAHAVQRALESLGLLIQGSCTAAFGAPTFQAVRDMTRFDGFRASLGAEDDMSAECRAGVLGRIFNGARALVCGPGANPLGRRDLVADLAPDDGGRGDLDADGELSNLEFLLFLTGPLQIAGLNAEGVQAQGCGLEALDALPAAGRALCPSDRVAAERDLVRAFRYAQALSLVAQPYIDALDFCRIELQVVPANVSLDQEGEQQFGAVVTGVIDTANNSDVTWSAARGTIDPGGFYTAPASGGTDTVTATSVLNPDRKASATITVGACPAGSGLGIGPRTFAFPGTNGLIAFARVLNGTTQIHVMNADGSGAVNISNNGVVDQNPVWSPDGTRIAFVSQRDGNNEIYVMNADGSAQTRLTNNAANDIAPAWSPDGQKIAFESLRSGDSDIWVMNADGSSPVNITNGGNSVGSQQPAWSPDGTKIAFARNGAIAVMNANGSSPVTLTDGDQPGTFDDGEILPDWSPDGQKIVYAIINVDNTSQLDEVFVMNADGSGQTNLTNGPSEDSSPSWSPAGDKIVYSRFFQGISLMNPDGSGKTPITSGQDFHPDWQPLQC